jgi:hypothetical protein
VTPTGITCASHRKAGLGRPLGTKTLAIRDGILELAQLHETMTVRGVFYALVSMGVVEKDEGRGYVPVQRQLVAMRRQGLVPWSFIADGVRWQRKPQTWNSHHDVLEHVVRAYRHNLWRHHDVRLEVWLEKDALAAVVMETTDPWDVPLMVSRGQSSITFLHAAAEQATEAWEQSGVETFVYALYDRDAGGQRAARHVRDGLAEFAPETPITFELLAVTDEQIGEYNLPTRPAKRSDPEAAKFRGPAVELDAFPPGALATIVEDAIIRHVDPYAWRLEQQVEQSEREILANLVEGRR